MSSETDYQSARIAETGFSREWLSTLSSRVASDGDDQITVRGPADDRPIGTVPDCEGTDVERAVERARRAQSAWAETRPERRSELLRRFSDLVVEHRRELLDLVQLETGKSRQHAVEELLDVPLTCSYYTETGADILADERRRGAVPGATTARVTYDPVGVVGVISPWNYPLTLSFTDLIPALMAGNSVVLKPDEKTPFTALALWELLDQAGMPENLVQVVTGQGAVAGPALVDTVDYVAFTGGTETGRLVAEQAGRNLVDCSLELGGNNPLLVLDDADIGMAARGAVQACFTNAGQLCLAAERLYVDESIYEEFVEEFVGATRRLSLGTEFSFESDVGSLIDGDQLDRVESHVEDAIESGASLLTGGRHRPDVGPFCYEPTILTNVDASSTVACEETFGPVVTVQPVTDTSAAVAAANDSPYGLNASVWTGDREHGEEVARQIDCGTVCVNDGYISAWGAIDAPMGGFGDSGLGRRHGAEGMRRFLESRTIATSRIGPVQSPRRVPDSWFARGLVELTRLQTMLRSAPVLGRLFR